MSAGAADPTSDALVRALVLEEPRRLEARRLPLPHVGEDDGVLRVEACGLCGTDHEQFTGGIRVAGPFVPGHEIVGVVEDVGRGAAERWGVTVGERVAVVPFQACRACAPCLAGDHRHCERHGFREFYGVIPVDRAPGLWGGYAEAAYLGPDALLLPVPEPLDPVLATVFNPLGAGIQWAVEMPETEPGAVVAVLGPGIRGLCAVAAAKDAGAGFVLVTGSGPRDAERLALAPRFGADLVVDVARSDPVRGLRDATGGRGADVVVDVTANAPAAFGQAIDLARPGGTVVVAGMRGFAPVDGFVPDVIVAKELKVLGALGVDAAAYRAAFALLVAGSWPFADLPRRCVGFDEAADLLRSMAGEVGAAPPPVHGVFVPG
ncbi:MAG TPA: zinc-binding dehydrogenase [Acidimicrobiales bacterium]|nr:zinc-binding dehydrogenase [Acidimicrobiales bacterium]